MAARPATTSPDTRVGISGWRYTPWRGAFYPAGLAQKSELAYASRALNSIEINGTFYSLQRPSSFQAWHDETPPGFVFSVKCPRFVTHMRKLRDVAEPVANFFASGVLALGEKLGPLLWQFPPNFGFDEARFAAFFDLLPTDTAAAAALARRRAGARMAGRTLIPDAPPRPLRHAVEFRHDTFLTPAFVRLCRAHNVAIVLADTAGLHPYTEDVTADFVYARLHGAEEIYASGYTPKALDGWAARFRLWRAGKEPADARKVVPGPPPRAEARDVYVYFDNDIKVMAPRDAAGLAARLGVTWAHELPLPAPKRSAGKGVAKGRAGRRGAPRMSG